MNYLFSTIFAKLNYFPFFARMADVKHKYYKYYTIYDSSYVKALTY